MGCLCGASASKLDFLDCLICINDTFWITWVCAINFYPGLYHSTWDKQGSFQYRLDLTKCHLPLNQFHLIVLLERKGNIQVFSQCLPSTCCASFSRISMFAFATGHYTKVPSANVPVIDVLLAS